MIKRLDHRALILLVAAGLSLIVGESMAKPSSRQPVRSLNNPRPVTAWTIPPEAIRSGVVYWDYRVGIVAKPETILTVSPGKVFILTDIVITPMIEPAGVDNPIDIKVYENATLKTIVYYPKDQIHFASGIPFAPGSQVNISQPAQGGTLLGNVIFGITVSGYEYTPPPPLSYVYLPLIELVK